MRPDTFHQLYRSIISGKAADVFFKAAGSLSPAEALAIYQSGYQARLTESLMEKYESVGRFLGDKQFQQLCQEFIATQNSFDANINHYGDAFPLFLEKSATVTDWPFLVDLAKLDLTRFRLFHQASLKGLDSNELISQISEFGDDDFKLELLPALQILESRYPLFDMWQSIYQDTDFPQPRPDSGQTLVFWKRGSQVYFKPVPAGIGLALQKIRWNFPALASMALLPPDEISQIFQFLGDETLVSKVKNCHEILADEIRT